MVLAENSPAPPSAPHLNDENHDASGALYTPDQVLIAHVALRTINAAIELTPMGREADLLDYVFHRGGSNVLLVVNDVVLRARLSTYWRTSRRHWAIACGERYETRDGAGVSRSSN
jgi:hypothetical protein